MKELLSAVVVLGSLILSAEVFGYGDQGHKAIWTVAQGYLHPATKQKVAAILAGDKLTLTAVWLDKARSAGRTNTGPLANDPETKSFNSQFPNNAEWHFVNLPLAAGSYQAGHAFTSKDDVVHAINKSIATLEGKHTGMSKRIALRALVHLVGDIHQPLHCGTGYYDVSNLAKPKLISQPSQAIHFLVTNDRGGNQLFYGGKFEELHAYWDSELVKNVAGGSGSVAQLATRLRTNMPNAQANTSGNYHKWAEAWAGESIKLANDAYTGVRLGRCTLSSKGTISQIHIVLPRNYKQKETPVVRDQLSKASRRLAALLNSTLE